MVFGICFGGPVEAAPLGLKAQGKTEPILIDVPSCKEWGCSAETLKENRA